MSSFIYFQFQTNLNSNQNIISQCSCKGCLFYLLTLKYFLYYAWWGCLLYQNWWYKKLRNPKLLESHSFDFDHSIVQTYSAIGKSSWNIFIFTLQSAFSFVTIWLKMATYTNKSLQSINKKDMIQLFYPFKISQQQGAGRDP